jgi:hypothetical protein
MALDHFTTWDDPKLWDIVRDVVCSPKRNAFIHNAEAQHKKSPTALGEPLDMTPVLNQQGLPTGNAKVLVSYDMVAHSCNVLVQKGGTDWSGTLTLKITKD